MQPLKPGTFWKDSITRLPASAPLCDIESVLREDGTVILEDLLGPNTLEQVNTELDPVLLGPRLGVQDEVAVLGRTVRFNSTLSQSPTVAQAIANHPTLVGPAEAILGRYTDTLQLAALAASEVTPGEEPQRLHRDDWNWGHARNRDHPWSVFSIIALTEFTADNGATRMVPGSHRWEDAYEASTSKETWHEGVYEEKSIPIGQYADLEIPAEMRPGSAVMALGTTLHGAGANTTTDVHRRGLQPKFCLGWLRPTVNNYLLYPPEVAKKLPESVQRLIGYQLECKHIGMLEQSVDPIELLS